MLLTHGHAGIQSDLKLRAITVTSGGFFTPKRERGQLASWWEEKVKWMSELVDV